MPVETKTSNLIRPRNTDAPQPDSVLLSAILRVKTGEVANAADASAGSKYRLFHLPSHCMVQGNTVFVVDTWGFAGVRIGTETNTTVLLNVAKTAAALQRPIAAGDDKYHRRFWEIMGFPKDPGGDITVFAHAETAATAAGLMRFQIHYLLD